MHKVTSLPTQDGVGQLFFLYCSSPVFSGRWWARAAGLHPLLMGPLLACTQTPLKAALAVTRPLSLAAARGSLRDDSAQGSLGGHREKPLSLGRLLQLGHWLPLWEPQSSRASGEVNLCTYTILLSRTGMLPTEQLSITDTSSELVLCTHHNPSASLWAEAPTAWVFWD